MRHFIAAKIVAVLAMLAFGSPAVADKRIALVVGNSDYSAAPALANPSNDANAIGLALERLGFTVLVGIDQNITEFRDLIYQFSQQAENADLALFFYAGHGLQVSGRNYLLPVDAALKSETDLDFSAIDLQLVLKQLERSAPNSIVLLDACRDNPFEAALSRSMGTTRSAASLSRGLAPVDTLVDTLGGALIGFATDPGAVAFDGTGQHSPFTEALLTHIETPGLEINGLMTRVRADVVTATGNRQRPWATSSLLQEVHLTPQTAPLADTARSLVATAVDGQGIPPNPDNDWEKFDERFQGTPQNDVIFGGSGVNWFRATTGNDYYSGDVPGNQYNITMPDIALRDIRWSYDADAQMLRGVHKILGTDYFDASVDNFWSVTPEGNGWMGLTSIVALAEPFKFNVQDVGRAVDNTTDIASAERTPTPEPAPEPAPQPTTQPDNAPQTPPIIGGPTLRSIPADTFTMGSDAADAERPLIPVDLSGFSISQSEITVGQYRHFIDQSGYAPDSGCYVWTENGRMRFRENANWSAPDFEATDDMPVACVNWQDAAAYADWLGQTLGMTGRLPSEAELEYAIRAGTTGAYPFTGGAEAACKAVNAADASSVFKWRNTACDDGFPQAAKVTALPANALGLVGTTGNLWEWAADCWSPTHKGASQTGAARTTGQCDSRALRGGSFDDPIENLRSAYRVGIPAKRRQANVGFRVVVDP